MSSDSESEVEWWSEPSEDVETESDEETDDGAAACTNGQAAQVLDDGFISVLFETPSGFAIFDYDGLKLRRPNALKEIWANFVDFDVARREVYLLKFKTFENKVNAINQDTGVCEELYTMILENVKPSRKLAVGNVVYKSIIEDKLGIRCLYDSAVAELMWGLKFQMQYLVTEEKTNLTDEDRLPMSNGMNCFLYEHGYDVKPDMLVSRHVIELAGRMYNYDRRVNKHGDTLRYAAQLIKKISRIDTKDWDLLKIATAIKVICCIKEEFAAPKLLFSARQLEKLRKNAGAGRYNMFLKSSSLAIYNQIYSARKLKTEAGRELTRFVKLREMSREQAEAANDCDGKNIHPVINTAVLDELKEYSTVISARRLERQVPPTLAPIGAVKRYTQISSHPLHRTNKPGILSIDIHPLKEDIVATGGMDTNAVLFNRLSGQTLCTLTGHSKEITSLKFVNWDELIVTGSADKTVRIWQRSEDENYSCIHTLKDHAAAVEAVTVHGSQKYFVTASKDNSWCFYDTSTGSCLTQVGEASGQEGYKSASFHPDGLILGTGSTDGVVKIWDVKTLSNVAKFEGHVGPVTDMSFSENGHFLATAALDGANLWDIRTSRIFCTLDSDTPTNAVQFDRSGCYLAVGSSDVRVYQVTNVKVELNVTRTLPDLSGTGKVTSVKFGTDANYIAVGSMDRNLRIFGLQSCQAVTQDKTLFLDSSEDSMESSEEMVTPRAATSEPDEEERKTAADEVPVERAVEAGTVGASEEVMVDAAVEVLAVVEEPEVKDLVVAEESMVQESEVAEAPMVEVPEVKEEVAKVDPVPEPEQKVDDDDVVVGKGTPVAPEVHEPEVKGDGANAVVQEPETRAGDVVVKDSRGEGGGVEDRSRA